MDQTFSPCWALGLMSGTSVDGVDAALICTDGQTITDFGPTVTLAYDDEFRDRVRAQFGAAAQSSDLTALAHQLTDHHLGAVDALRAKAADIPIRVIGFHGQTLFHAPEDGVTVQIGDGAQLAARTGIDVVNDFRSRDVAHGGQGAPLAPLYHQALVRGAKIKCGQAVAILNLGGVGNVTWIGPEGNIHAFDTGPANALIDDWVLSHTGAAFDEDGALARRGSVDEHVLAALGGDPYFDLPAPKSLDRDHFTRLVQRKLAGVGPADGAAILTEFTALAVARSVAQMPQAPARWLVCGGGRHNPAVMGALKRHLAGPVDPVEAVGWDGDALEAQAFAFLAVRSLRGLPLSLPTTTGVDAPCTGGRLHLARDLSK